MGMTDGWEELWQPVDLGANPSSISAGLCGLGKVPEHL